MFQILLFGFERTDFQLPVLNVSSWIDDVTAESGYGSLGGGGGRAGPCSSTRPDAGLPLPDRGDDGHYYLGSNRFPRWACTTAPIVGLFTRRLGDRSGDTDTVIMHIRPRAVFAGTISAIAASYKKCDSTTSPEAGQRFLTPRCPASCLITIWAGVAFCLLVWGDNWGPTTSPSCTTGKLQCGANNARDT